MTPCRLAGTTLTSPSAERDLRDAGDEFEQVRLLRNHLAKKTRRMRKRLAELESLGLSLSLIKDPTIPF